jgi:hypothetical protein
VAQAAKGVSAWRPQVTDAAGAPHVTDATGLPQVTEAATFPHVTEATAGGVAMAAEATRVVGATCGDHGPEATGREGKVEALFRDEDPVANAMDERDVAERTAVSMVPPFGSTVGTQRRQGR